MSGQTGARGYLIQTLICLLSSLEDQAWQGLIIEPNLGDDKVDIIWFYPDSSTVVQVKHSQNPISLSLVKKWSDDLEKSVKADKYELKLVGPCTIDVTKQQAFGKVIIPTPLPLNVKAFIEQGAQKFDRFLHSKGISQIPAFARELVVEALAARLALESTMGNKINREDFDRLLIEWTLVVYPNSLNQAVHELQLAYDEKVEQLKLQLREQERVSVAKYQLKYEACLEALNVVDAIFLFGMKDGLDRAFKGILPFDLKDPYQLGAMARQCHNKLVISCDSPELIKLFRKAIGADGLGYGMDIIVDLREAIRKELGFGHENVDPDRRNAWFATLGSKFNTDL